MKKETVPVAGRFSAGDPVPEWALSVVPKTAEFVRGSLTFAVDCVLVEIDDSYVAIQSLSGKVGGPTVSADGMRSCAISAAGKPFRMILGEHVLWPKDDPRKPLDTFDVPPSAPPATPSRGE